MGSHAAVDAHQGAVAYAKLVVQALVTLMDANTAVGNQSISLELCAKARQDRFAQSHWEYRRHACHHPIEQNVLATSGAAAMAVLPRAELAQKCADLNTVGHEPRGFFGRTSLGFSTPN